ncbi:MAG: BCCT family transporter [Bacillota bacterium]|nr:BCCT family transporter [Bacillota bacterium]
MGNDYAKKNKNNKPAYRFDVTTIAVSTFLLLALLVCTIVMSDTLVNGLVNAKAFIIKYFGCFFILFVASMLIYNLWLAFSKYGSIRLGRVKPQYSTFGWVAMIFCAAMGTSILFWSAIEWAYYIVWLQPMGMGPEETANFSVAYSFFHWGIPAWSVYATGVVPIAYRYYVRQKEGLTLQGGCEGVLGDKAHGPWGTVINIIFIFSILGGLTISYGTGIPMLANVAHVLLGVPENFVTFAVLVIAITAMFTWSACSGIAKGIQILSKLCIYMALALVVYFLLFGNTLFEIENTVQSLGLSFQNFVQMLFYVDPTRASGGFPQEWTVFYWAWWLGLAPVMWIFIAKCSAGRSIRSVVGTVILAGTAGSVIFFGAISNHGLGEILLSSFDWANLGANGTFLDSFYNTFNEYNLVSDVLATLPLSKMVTAIWFLVGFILLVTTMDSAAFTMGAACTKGLRTWQDPPVTIRIFWAFALSVCPLCLLWSGSSLSGFQAVLIITALPTSVVILLCILSCSKWLKEDFGHMTRQEIQEYFMLDDEMEEYQRRRQQTEKLVKGVITDFSDEEEKPSEDKTAFEE